MSTSQGYCILSVASHPEAQSAWLFQFLATKIHQLVEVVLAPFLLKDIFLNLLPVVMALIDDCCLDPVLHLGLQNGGFPVALFLLLFVGLSRTSINLLVIMNYIHTGKAGKMLRSPHPLYWSASRVMSWRLSNLQETPMRCTPHYFLCKSFWICGF